ncbi:MAG: endonuclease/exonuclease/phosphatase family protein [Candidatus Sumerlaeia bacterium]|nr:endonuclease/exonuclease/phosphatase family protein [Candidatus Sumerlaeia bacterium]
MGNRRFILPRLRDALRTSGADIVFLQEVLGRHDEHAQHVEGWPSAPQMEYLADSVWTSFAYGRNAIYQAGHHGNAILSKYVISEWSNHDISSSRAERRGVLHGRVQTPAGPLHCVCLHLSLMERDRLRQMESIAGILSRVIPDGEPVILAGDFNDWRRSARRALAQPASLIEAFHRAQGQEARTFPSVFPLLPLDRIYVRGVDVAAATVLSGEPWNSLSDHVPLLAELVRHA